MQLITLDSARSDIIFVKNDTTCLNLNAIFKRSFDSELLRPYLDHLKDISSVNLCNLASLCYRLKIDYCSADCIELIGQLVNEIRLYNNTIKFTQLNISNNLEIDLKPISDFTYIDTEHNIIYISKILKDILRFLGFLDGQITTLIMDCKNLVKYIPKDLLSFVPLENTKSIHTYKEIVSILSD